MVVVDVLLERVEGEELDYVGVGSVMVRILWCLVVLKSLEDFELEGNFVLLWVNRIGLVVAFWIDWRILGGRSRGIG